MQWTDSMTMTMSWTRRKKTTKKWLFWPKKVKMSFSGHGVNTNFLSNFSRIVWFKIEKMAKKTQNGEFLTFFEGEDEFSWTWCRYKKCRYWSKLSFYAVWAKSLEPFLRKWAKTSIFDTKLLIKKIWEFSRKNRRVSFLPL